MYYAVSQDIFAKLPTACFGAVAVRGLDNTCPQSELAAMLHENIATGFVDAGHPKFIFFE